MLTRKKLLPLLLLAALAASCLACWFCWRYDNKYTRPRPVSNMGVTRLDMGWYDAAPFFYLTDGWSFYRDKLLTPAQISNHTPDAYFYIGRYGGFDLGDPESDPHGQGTYRTVLLLDGTPRRFALELAPIFSRWRIWVNGQLVQSVGMGDEDTPAPARTMAVFEAVDRVEIVVQAADDTGCYSGMVYPPALGSPRRVDEVLSARLLMHGGACVLSLLLAVVCLLAGTLLRFARPYRALSLLCLCLCGATAGPVLWAFGLSWTGSPGQRVCIYGIFLSLLWTVGRVCGPPRVIRWSAAGAGLAVCAAVLLQPLFPVPRAGTLYAFSAALGLYKVLAALWLLAVSGWALRKGRRGSAALLAGGVIFAGALIMDRLLPVYEPIYGGWFVELAGWAILLLVGGAAFCDTVALYRADGVLRTELAVRTERDRLQQEFIGGARESLHENRARLTLISHYLDTGDAGKLRAYLDGQLGADCLADHRQYTGNDLVDAVLAAEFSRAEGENIYIEQDLAPLPESLRYDDGDLVSLLLNLLDNAVESCERLESPEDRWISLSIAHTAAGMEIRCVNAAPPTDGREGTSKPDKLSHGFGRGQMRRIVRRYGGTMETTRLEESCSVLLTLKEESQ